LVILTNSAFCHSFLGATPDYSHTNPHLDANSHANVAGRAALCDAAGHYEGPGASIAHGHTDVIGYPNANPDSDMVAHPYLDAYLNANARLPWRPVRAERYV